MKNSEAGIDSALSNKCKTQVTDVVNIYMGNNIQIGSLPSALYDEILNKAKRDARLYLLQLLNAIGVFGNCYLQTLKIFFLFFLIVNVAYYMNGDSVIAGSISALQQIILEGREGVNIEMLKVFMNTTFSFIGRSIIDGALIGAFCSFTTLCVTCYDFLKSKSTGKERRYGLFGHKNYFMDFVDSEIKKILQEQAQGATWIAH